MVTPKSRTGGRTRRKPASRAPLFWRILLTLNRGFIGITGRLEVTGTVPGELRRGHALLVSNHIGLLDPFVLLAACHKLGIAPRFLMAGGLLDAPVIGPALRACGHIRVDRGKATVAEAFGRTVDALDDGGPIVVYPEGRISLDPGLWPERGKTGAARLALAGGVPVVPVSQWGAHEAAIWGTETVTGWRDFWIVAASWLRSVRTRPRLRVHFGDPVDLSDLTASTPGDAVRAHERIMRTITTGIVGLRAEEPDVPRFRDPTRPTTTRSPWRP